MGHEGAESPVQQDLADVDGQGDALAGAQLRRRSPSADRAPQVSAAQPTGPS